MSKNRVDLNKLSEQSQELCSLIAAANGILNDSTPVSDLRWEFEEKVSDLTPAVMKIAKAAVATRRNPKELIVGAAIALGAVTVGWAAAAGIDATRNGIAQSKARKVLLGYYEQLAAKQGMIIEEQQRICQEMAEIIEKLSSNEEIYRQKIQTLQKKQTELANLLFRINTLRNSVEK